MHERDHYIDIAQISTDSPILSVCGRRVCVPPQSWLANSLWGSGNAPGDSGAEEFWGAVERGVRRRPLRRLKDDDDDDGDDDDDERDGEGDLGEAAGRGPAL